MSDAPAYEDLKTQADTINEAFEREFKRFERFVGDRMDPDFVDNLLKELQPEGYSLSHAEGQLCELNELRVRFIGERRLQPRRRLAALSMLRSADWQGSICCSLRKYN
jgi:hypothetical protein